MKVVFLAREGHAAEWIASTLAKSFDLKVIFESGRPARLRKLKRYFRLRDFWLWPVRVLDVVAVMLFNMQIGKSIRERLPSRFSGEVSRCDDVNEPQVKEKIQKWAPDAVVVYGTSILKPEILQVAPLFLNLHGGIVPRYRNVHSEFWALAKSQPQCVGTSVLYLDSGIDTGDIALQSSVHSSSALTVTDAVYANLLLAADLAASALELSSNQQLPRLKQSGEAGSFPTPGFVDLMRAWIFRRPPIR